MFDESDNGILSDVFNDLNLNKPFDDVSEEENANEKAIDGKKIMQEPIQSLEHVEDKQVEHIKDSQPYQETNAEDLERQTERTVIDTPINDSPNEVSTSSLNGNTPCIHSKKEFQINIKASSKQYYY